MKTPIDLASDNTAPVAPEIMEAIQAVDNGTAPSYGADAETQRLDRLFCDLFERDVSVLPVATGTAANALAMASLSPPHGAIFCHADAHLNVDECGAPEFFTHGAKLVPLEGDHGLISPDTLRAALRHFPRGVQHRVQPHVLSVTQATEAGTLYRPDALDALCEAAHGAGLKVHMDGARFANAVAALGVSPADATWRAGIDILSFGVTKNGGMAAEALVFFEKALFEEALYRRKRAGHLFSKMRYLSAQIATSLEEGRWLRWAAHANAMATRLAKALEGRNGLTIFHPVEANMVFLALSAEAARTAHEKGLLFHRMPLDDKDGGVVLGRFVTSYATTGKEVAEAAQILAGAVG